MKGFMGKGKKRAVKEKYSRKENMMGFLFILPAMIPLLVFWIIPIIWSGGLSFTDWDMMSENIHFMGLKNYTSLLKDPNFGKVLWNTLVFALGSTVPSIVIGLLVALAMNGARRGTGIYRTVIFAPYITPMVAVSVVWSWIFEPRVGILNFVLELFGLPGSQWTQSSETAMLSVLIVTVWKSIGWTMIFYMEAIRKVPQNLLEAAAIDGCPPMRTFWKIMFPMAQSGIVTVTIFNFINIWNEYFLSLIFASSDKLKPVAPGLYGMINSMKYTGDWAGMFAAVIIVFLPTFILYIFLSEKIIGGVTGGIKG